MNINKKINFENFSNILDIIEIIINIFKKYNINYVIVGTQNTFNDDDIDRTKFIIYSGNNVSYINLSPDNNVYTSVINLPGCNQNSIDVRVNFDRYTCHTVKSIIECISLAHSSQINDSIFKQINK